MQYYKAKLAAIGMLWEYQFLAALSIGTDLKFPPPAAKEQSVEADDIQHCLRPSQYDCTPPEHLKCGDIIAST